VVEGGSEHRLLLTGISGSNAPPAASESVPAARSAVVGEYPRLSRECACGRDRRTGSLGIQPFVALTSLPRALAPHLAKPDGDVDPGSGAGGMPIGGGRRRRAVDAGKQAEDLVRQKA